MCYFSCIFFLFVCRATLTINVQIDSNYCGSFSLASSSQDGSWRRASRRGGGFCLKWIRLPIRHHCSTTWAPTESAVGENDWLQRHGGEGKQSLRIPSQWKPQISFFLLLSLHETFNPRFKVNSELKFGWQTSVVMILSFPRSNLKIQGGKNFHQTWKKTDPNSGSAFQSKSNK